MYTKIILFFRLRSSLWHVSTKRDFFSRSVNYCWLVEIIHYKKSFYSFQPIFLSFEPFPFVKPIPIVRYSCFLFSGDVTEKAAKVVTKPALIKRFRRRAYGLSGCVTTKLRQQSSTIAFLLMVRTHGPKENVELGLDTSFPANFSGIFHWKVGLFPRPRNWQMSDIFLLIKIEFKQFPSILVHLSLSLSGSIWS